jgi:hypothetical protein
VDDEDERRLKIGLAAGLSALRTALKNEPSGAEANDGAASVAAAAASTELWDAARCCASDECNRGADEDAFNDADSEVDDAKAAEMAPDREGRPVAAAPSAADAV